MSDVTTTRPIDHWGLAQLAESPLIGGSEANPIPLSMSDDGTERTITCHDETVTQAQLEAAIEAHEPAPPPPSDADVIANLKTRLTATEQALDQIIIDALMGDFPPL